MGGEDEDNLPHGDVNKMTLYQCCKLIKTSGLPSSVGKVLYINAQMFANLGYEFEECWLSGLTAAIEALKDGEITSDGKVSKGAKRHIRRQMGIFAPSWKLTGIPLIDYKYIDGRTTKQGARCTPKDKYTRYRAKMRELGNCPRCGKKPEEDFTQCNRCRQKMRKRKAEAQARYMQKKKFDIYGSIENQAFDYESKDNKVDK